LSITEENNDQNENRDEIIYKRKAVLHRAEFFDDFLVNATLFLVFFAYVIPAVFNKKFIK